MTLVQLARKIVPPSLKRFMRGLTRESRLARLLGPHLPGAICVDVGASYYPHVKWRLFLESPRTEWIAVEPNVANIGYIQTWPWPARVSAVTTGLSEAGGSRRLYITNVDSGSSLLEPVIPPSMTHRLPNLDYFFPVRTQDIDTLTLAQVVAGGSPQSPVFVKLDTQGTELSILTGATELINAHRIVGIELEATLLAQPFMKGSGKFWQACEYLEDGGFELLHIKPIVGLSRLGISHPRGNICLNECDAVFALRQDVAAGLSPEYRVGLFTFYLTNRFYEEALSVIETDSAVRALLSAQGCSVDQLSSTIRAFA